MPAHTDNYKQIKDISDDTTPPVAVAPIKPRKLPKKARQILFGPPIEIPPILQEAKEWIIKTIFKGEKSWAAAHDAPKKKGDKHGLENIVGIHIGQKRTKNGPTSQLCVIVQVLKKPKNKREEAKFRKDVLIPKAIKIRNQTVLTDIQIGHKMTPHSVIAGNPCGLNRKEFIQDGPEGPGLYFSQGSIGFCGTMMYQGDDDTEDTPYGVILGNSHVFGTFLNLIDEPIKLNDRVHHPLGGNQAIGLYIRSGGDNIDGAVALASSKVDLNQHDGFTVSPTAFDDLPRAAPDMRVKLYSHRSSAVRNGTVLHQGFGADQSITYHSGTKILSDTFQVMSDTNEVFSFEGDSGAGIVNADTNEPVGLLIAGNGRTSLCQQIVPICNALGIIKILG